MTDSPVAAGPDLGDPDRKPAQAADPGERPALAWLLPWVLAAAGILFTMFLSR
jgi:hypothetical protein